jgi:two-component system nitrogen regulation response regulator NtrX
VNRTARVLVADDEASIRFVLREALEEEGHDVVEAASGDPAWEILAAGEVDIAFLDIRMPELTGLELIARLRNTASDTPSRR